MSDTGDSDKTFKFKPTDAQKAEAKEKHRRIFVVSTEFKDDDEALAYEVLCRLPKRVEWQRYMAIQTGDRMKLHGAAITLFTQCLVWPTLKELAPEFDDLPPLETALAGLFVATVDECFQGEGKKLGRDST